mmetsp:Transcript_3414/g.9871  ORF Transcript_3414/g.9871 Transcript_3414/m.9871 type:complete len:212 (+) Transcript_3414:2297-2932(+)
MTTKRLWCGPGSHVWADRRGGASTGRWDGGYTDGSTACTAAAHAVSSTRRDETAPAHSRLTCAQAASERGSSVAKTSSQTSNGTSAAPIVGVSTPKRWPPSRAASRCRATWRWRWARTTLRASPRGSALSAAATAAPTARLLPGRVSQCSIAAKHASASRRWSCRARAPQGGGCCKQAVTSSTAREKSRFLVMAPMMSASSKRSSNGPPWV